jgi:hypothetical protein
MNNGMRGGQKKRKWSQKHSRNNKNYHFNLTTKTGFFSQALNLPIGSRTGMLGTLEKG